MASKKKSTKKTASARTARAKKAPAARTSAKKKASAGKAKAEKRPAAKKKVTAKSAPIKKAATRKAPAKKTSAKKAPTKKAPARKNNVPKASADRTAAASPPKRTGKHLSAKELRQYQQLLLNLRDRVVDEISFLAGDNLNSVQLERTGEEGTDNFNREFALKLVSSEQDIIYEIDEALRRMRHGTYGICEISGEPIEKERLKVMPHARHSVKVQSELEKGRARFRPFGPTISRS